MTTRTSTTPIAESRGFTIPNEVRSFEKGKVEVIDIGGGKITRATLQPGWKWSSHVKPLMKTDWCEVAHFDYQVQGSMHVVMSDGREFDVRPGDVAFVPPGHDAWVTGDEVCIAVDWSGLADFARVG